MTPPVVLVTGVVHFEKVEYERRSSGAGGTTLCGVRFVPHTYFATSGVGSATSRDPKYIRRCKQSCAACLKLATESTPCA